MRNRRGTSWLLGFAGSAVAHVCALAVLFAFGRDARIDARSAADPVRDAIALTPIDPAFAAADPLASAISVDVEPPAPAWEARQGDRDNLVPQTVAPSDSDGR